MSNFQTLKSQASELRKAKNYEAALLIYKDLWLNYRNQCNEWEGWGYAYCLKQVKQYNEALTICEEVLLINSNFENIRSLFAWCIYYTDITVDPIRDEFQFLNAANKVLDFSKQEDKYSPYTITTMKVLEYLNSKSIQPYDKILFWTGKLQPELLDEVPFSYMDGQGKQREKASKKEQYFMLRTKSLYETGAYKDCISLCQIALDTFTKFHYDNDIWFSRLIALSNIELGNDAVGLAELKELLKRKKEWFIQKEIAEVCLKQHLEDEALSYGLDGALNYGDAEMKVNLYKLLAEILEMKGKSSEAKRHIEYVYQIKKSHQFKIDSDLFNLLDKYQIDQNNSADVRELHRQMKQLWENLKFGGQDQLKGMIKSLLPTGKAGFIEDDKRKSYFFQTKDFKGKRELIIQGQKVTFFLQDGFDTKKNRPTVNAINIKPLR